MSADRPYDAVIMDHIRNARNYRVPEAATGKAKGFNPLCGDEMTVYVRVHGGVIRDAAFQCSCCGISMASASIMTEIMLGLHETRARALLETFTAALKCGACPEGASVEQQALLATVRDHPARLRCALLPWATLGSSMQNRLQTVIPHP